MNYVIGASSQAAQALTHAPRLVFKDLISPPSRSNSGVLPSDNLFLTLPRAQALDRCHPSPAAPSRRAPSCMATTLNGRRARSCVTQGYFSGFCLARRNAPRSQECAADTGRPVSRSAQASVCPQLNLVGVRAHDRARARVISDPGAYNVITPAWPSGNHVLLTASLTGGER